MTTTFAPAPIATTVPTRVPTTVRRAQFAIAAVAAIHVLALLLVLTHRDVIAGAIAAQHPGADVTALAASAVWQAAIPHIVLAVLFPLRAWRLRNGRPSSRIVLTVVLGIQLLAHASLPMVLGELPGYGVWVIAIQAVSLVFEIAALVLLWTKDSNSFFRSTSRSYGR
jgi:hypothetical protein